MVISISKKLSEILAGRAPYNFEPLNRDSETDEYDLARIIIGIVKAVPNVCKNFDHEELQLVFKNVSALIQASPTKNDQSTQYDQSIQPDQSNQPDQSDESEEKLLAKKALEIVDKTKKENAKLSDEVEKLEKEIIELKADNKNKDDKIKELVECELKYSKLLQDSGIYPLRNTSSLPHRSRSIPSLGSNLDTSNFPDIEKLPNSTNCSHVFDSDFVENDESNESTNSTNDEFINKFVIKIPKDSLNPDYYELKPNRPIPYVYYSKKEHVAISAFYPIQLYEKVVEQGLRLNARTSTVFAEKINLGEFKRQNNEKKEATAIFIISIDGEYSEDKRSAVIKKFLRELKNHMKNNPPLEYEIEGMSMTVPLPDYYDRQWAWFTRKKVNIQ